MGNGIEGAGKDGSNGAVPGSDVQGYDAVGDLVRQRELGGDGLDSQVPGGVPPPGGTMDHRYEGETRGRRRVGVPPGIDGN